MQLQEDVLRQEIFSVLDSIRRPDMEAMRAAKVRWNSIAKPLHSLGRLEDAIVQIAGIQHSADIEISDKAIVVLCGDHGVVREGVSQTGSEVTRIVAENIAAGQSCVSLIARRAGAEVFVIDMGMDCEAFPQKTLVPGEVVDRKVRRGTGNIAVERAMTQQECLQAVRSGIGIAQILADRGVKVIGLGEMGIGNTTPSSVIASICYDLLPEVAAGRGAGLSEDGLEKKVEIVSQTRQRYWDEAASTAGDEYFPARVAVELLSQVGGAEIAGMTGVCIGAAARGLTVVLDGFISDIAAAVAVLMQSRCRAYLIASHLSSEPAATVVLNMLKMNALIDADMHPGEGCGAAAAMPLLDMAADVYREMQTFEQIGVQAYEDYGAKKSGEK